MFVLFYRIYKHTQFWMICRINGRFGSSSNIALLETNTIWSMKHNHTPSTVAAIPFHSRLGHTNCARSRPCIAGKALTIGYTNTVSVPVSITVCPPTCCTPTAIPPCYSSFAFARIATIPTQRYELCSWSHPRRFLVFLSVWAAETMQFPVNIPIRRRRSALILLILYACFGFALICVVFILLLVDSVECVWVWLGLVLVCLVCLI